MGAFHELWVFRNHFPDVGWFIGYDRVSIIYTGLTRQPQPLSRNLQSLPFKTNRLIHPLLIAIKITQSDAGGDGSGIGLQPSLGSNKT